MGVHYEYYSCLSRVTPSGPCGACYVRLEAIEDQLDAIHATDWLTPDEREQVRSAVRDYIEKKALVARSESDRHVRRLRELTTQQQKLVQLYYRDAVSIDVLHAEQARITAERAQVEHWATAARHQVDDVMTALDEALALVDAGQRAYDSATESQRRLLNLAIFDFFTVVEEPDDVMVEPQLEAFYEQLVDFVAVRPANGNGRLDGQGRPAQARTAALAAATGASNGPDRDANPSPVSWGQGSHSERMAEGEGFEPSVAGLPLQRFSRPPRSTTPAPLRGARGRLSRIGDRRSPLGGGYAADRPASRR